MVAMSLHRPSVDDKQHMHFLFSTPTNSGRTIGAYQAGYSRGGTRRGRPGISLESKATIIPCDGKAFLFNGTGTDTLQRRVLVTDTDDEESYLTADAMKLPEFELPHAISMLPAVHALAASQLGLSPGMALCCLPIVTPFSMPHMTPAVWYSNKRALAYNRMVVITVYIQGACAIFKFGTGNMVGGFFDGIQAAMGFYSLMPEGMRFLPTYMMMAGFNGVIGLLQVVQTYNGVPLQMLPIMPILAPVAAITSAYFGYQFCKEVRKIAGGIPDEADGAQSSCFVRTMGGDWFPSFLTAPLYGPSQDGRSNDDEGFSGGIHGYGGRSGAQQRFSVFEGSGHRLGEN